MTESNMTGPMIAAQRISKLARQPGGTNKRPRQKSAFLLDTRLSSSPLPTNSTRHSVTSRIGLNFRPLSYLIFSTRHLNATLENRNNVEKFNICIRFFAAPDATRRACLPGPCGWDINAPGTRRVRARGAGKRRPQCDNASVRPRRRPVKRHAKRNARGENGDAKRELIAARHTSRENNA